MDGQWSCYLDVIDTPIKPCPIEVGHGAIGVLQGCKGRGGRLGRAKDAGHELRGGHIQGRVKVAIYDLCLQIRTCLNPGQQLLDLIQAERIVTP
jgi:hypothetical protein